MYFENFLGVPHKSHIARKVFISYASPDLPYLRTLETHLALLQRQGYIEHWHDRKLVAGDEWDGKIRKELKAADLVLFLLSADFFASDYIWHEGLRLAMERERAGEAKVIPVFVRPCLWEDTPLSALQGLPAKGKPISSSDNEDEAWVGVVRGIKAAVDKLNGK